MNGEFMYMRCVVYIINLIVRDGLVEVDSNVVVIRNVVGYVRFSTIRLRLFEFRVDSGKMIRGSLLLDVKIRWNFIYLMLSRVFEFRLVFDKMEVEDRFYNDYFMEFDGGVLRVGFFVTVDWYAVERLVRFLIIFYNSILVVFVSIFLNSYKCYGEIVII